MASKYAVSSYPGIVNGESYFYIIGSIESRDGVNDEMLDDLSAD